jgi:hypothetical protein
MDRQPEPFPIRFLFSLALGTFTLVLGAVCWGLAGYFSGRVFALLGLLIGAGASAAILLPLRPISKRTALLLLPVVILATLSSICLGELAYIVLFMMRDFNSSLAEAVVSVGKSMGAILTTPDSMLSGVFGLTGAATGFLSVWQYL